MLMTIEGSRDLPNHRHDPGAMPSSTAAPPLDRLQAFR